MNYKTLQQVLDHVYSQPRLDSDELRKRLGEVMDGSWDISFAQAQEEVRRAALWAEYDTCWQVYNLLFDMLVLLRNVTHYHPDDGDYRWGQEGELRG